MDLPGWKKFSRKSFLKPNPALPGPCSPNVLAKVPRRIKKEVADDLRSIFYASSQEKAKAFNKDL